LLHLPNEAGSSRGGRINAKKVSSALSKKKNRVNFRKRSCSKKKKEKGLTGRAYRKIVPAVQKSGKRKSRRNLKKKRDTLDARRVAKNLRTGRPTVGENLS